MRARLAIMLGISTLSCLLAGCTARKDEPVVSWGRRGVQDGDFVKPRAAVIDSQGRLCIVDFTARIQTFDLDGTFIGPTWRPPEFARGRPSGLSLDRDRKNIILCDSHYHCLRIYALEGTEARELRKIGGTPGTAPGEFGYVTDAVQDADGFYYISETGLNDRITKLDPDGKLVATWGSAGSAPGQFSRARALALGPDGNLYVADSCNHRIQVLKRDGTVLRTWGEAGTAPGQLGYPYDLAFGPEGDLYVVEFGNNRVQKFTPDGKSLGVWGGPGRGPGQLDNPWALVVDKQGRVHVIDTGNHRVQRIEF